ncbi:PREDICTED: venom serine protease-like [Trachymyrmex cornetzi]|uniref:venom serine protease-like n=1 Tax=Trachymyrmex cornetzi TaxID=471704 RepID=UPI00084EFE7D|nr:PREDICTED: venom serine protease-like [Trachymyrmex cornetzi]
MQTSPQFSDGMSNVTLPDSDCNANKFLVNNGRSTSTYCGIATFAFEGFNPTIKLISTFNSQSRFSCKIETDTNNDTNTCQCSRKKVTKIVGGKETQVNEFPWMVGFMNAESGKIFYGGTIISEQYVITAGHCVVMLMRRFLNRTIVVVGEHDTSTDRDTNATKIYQLSRCITHEYDSSAFVYNSIGICKIVGSIKFSAEVGPVCLPFKHKNDSFTGDKVTALGWGLLEYAGNKSDTLQKVDLDVVPHEECPDSNDTNICTFTLGKDTCVLDEGGPLLWQDPATHNLVLAGAHIDWIESVTSGARYCKIE